MAVVCASPSPGMVAAASVSAVSAAAVSVVNLWGGKVFHFIYSDYFTGMTLSASLAKSKGNFKLIHYRIIISLESGGSHATETETCDHEVVIILGEMLRDRSQTRDG